ncbi:MAG: glycosyltransferase family 2 protein [Desulfobacteraceae bacterium]|nr:glycosyltransferase family 2 protein [Desulfobacteraceae bacterium]
MASFLLGLCWLLLIAALLLRVVRQLAAFRPVFPAPAGEDVPEISVIVPARNEAANILPCLRGLLGQAYPARCLEIIVVDDDSADDTRWLVEKLLPSHPNLRLLRAGPLPEGWTGKPHACWRGALAARGAWLCFLDADTRPSPSLLPAALGHAATEGLDLLSLHPRKELRHFWEKLIIPGGLLAAAFASDLRAVNDPGSPHVSANGQFLLFRREAYEALGGHAAVRAEVCEDKGLARLAKQAGLRTRLADGAGLFSVRMYPDLRGLWQGLTKDAVEIAPRPAMVVGIALGAVLVGWLSLLVPALDWRLMAGPAPGGWAAAGLCLAFSGSAAIYGLQMATARYFRIPVWYGLLFPLAMTLIAGVALHSAWQRRLGRVVWKMRRYPVGFAGHHGEEGQGAWAVQGGLDAEIRSGRDERR